MNEGTNSADSDDNVVPTGKVTVTLQSTAGNTTQTGAGDYDAGDNVTINTSAPQGSSLDFNGWFEVAGGQETLVSSSQQYTFTASRNITLKAQWVSQD